MSFLPEQFHWHLKQVLLLAIIGGSIALWLYQPRALMAVAGAAVAISVFRMLWHWLLFFCGVAIVAALFMINHLYGLIGLVVLVILSNILHPFFMVARAVEKVV